MKHGTAEGLFWSLDGYDNTSKEFFDFFPEEKLEVEAKAKELKPLIVQLHGGPHGTIAGHAKLRLFLLLRGYNLLLPNFTGSCGYGQKNIEALMGKIGQIDIEEIMSMIEQLIDARLCDPSRIIVMGGSYGGYLSGLLATSSKYSSFFKAAILLNPVVNIPFVAAISDIPEWASAVSLGEINKWHLTPDDVKLMYQQSPMAGKCSVPCLLLLGGKDRRIPHQGSLAFRNKAVAEGGNVETFVYPESGHALGDPVSVEYDVYARILGFVGKYMDE